MFMIYIPTEEIPLATTIEVIGLLRSYPFQLEDDFFTIGRGEIEYLEIFKDDDVYSLSHIGEKSDTSTPIAEGLPFAVVQRVATAFCRADHTWLSLVEKNRLHATAGSGDPQPNDIPRPPTPGGAYGQHDSFHDAAPPIQPQAFGCAPFALLALLGALMLMGMAAALFYSTGAN